MKQHIHRYSPCMYGLCRPINNNHPRCGRTCQAEKYQTWVIDGLTFVSAPIRTPKWLVAMWTMGADLGEHAR